jgi:hypothetical protein
MDVGTLLTSLGSSPGFSAGAAWIAKQIISHALKAGLERRKSEWQAELEKHKAAPQREKVLLEGAVKERVESELGEKASEREYRLEGCKRLYRLVGLLRFQLLVARRDLAGRIEAQVRRQYVFKVTSIGPESYYGRSTLYRLLTTNL